MIEETAARLTKLTLAREVLLEVMGNTKDEDPILSLPKPAPKAKAKKPIRVAPDNTDVTKYNIRKTAIEAMRTNGSTSAADLFDELGLTSAPKNKKQEVYQTLYNMKQQGITERDESMRYTLKTAAIDG
jgi:Fe2+ or Zn2+ uptake regulation protein